MGRLNFTENNYHPGGMDIFYPIDNYKIPEEVLSLASEYHILHVPILGQTNNFGLIPFDWCSRATSAIHYNYLLLVHNDTENQRDNYIKHWRGKSNAYDVDIRTPNGTRCFVKESFLDDNSYPELTIYNYTEWYYFWFQNIADWKKRFETGVEGYQNDENFSNALAYFKQFNPLNEKSRAECDQIKADPELVKKIFEEAIKSLKNNNPIPLNNRLLKHGGIGDGHWLSITGYAILENELWFLMADPYCYLDKTRNGVFSPYDVSDNYQNIDRRNINNYNHIMIMEGDLLNAKGELFFMKAARLLDVHPEEGGQALFKSMYIDVENILPAPDDIVTSSFRDPLVFPMQGKSTNLQSPLEYYAKSEISGSGYYPAGSSQSLHGGIHLKSNDPMNRTPVRCIADGYIVAARLVAKEAGINWSEEDSVSNEERFKFLKNFTSFVLVRHHFQSIKNDGTIDKELPLYSLYMHLQPPEWIDEELKKEFYEDPYIAEVNWIQKLSFGALNDVFILSEGNDFGRFYNAAEDLGEETAEQKDFFKVHDFGDEIKVIRRESEAGLNAFARAGNGEIRKAYNGLLGGNVVIFEQPFLSVQKGEIIGHVRKVAGKSEGYVHWELFSTTEEIDSLKEILNLYEGGTDLVKGFSETKENDDNFLQASEINQLFGNLEFSKLFNMVLKKSVPEEIADDILHQGTQSAEIIQEALQKLENSQWHELLKYSVFRQMITEFYNNINNSGFIRKNNLLYRPVKVTLPSDLNLDDEDSVILVKYKDYENDIYNDLESCKISELKEGKIINIPLYIKELQFSSKNYHVIAKADYNSDEAEAAAFSEIIRYRLRNIAVQHSSEWSPRGLKKLLDKLYDYQFLELESEDESKEDAVLRYWKNTYALTFWNRPAKDENDIMGEKDNKGYVQVFSPADDSIKSLIDIMQTSDKVHNIHPVTGVWLIHLLRKQNKLKINNDFSDLFKNNPPVFYGLLRSMKDLLVNRLKVVVIGERSSAFCESKWSVTANGEEFIKDKKITFNNGNGFFSEEIIPYTWGKFKLSLTSAGQAETYADGEISIEKPVIDYEKSVISEKPVFVEKPENAPRDFIRFRLEFTNLPIANLKSFVFFEYCLKKEGSEEPEQWVSIEKPLLVNGVLQNSKQMDFIVNPYKMFLEIREKYNKKLETQEYLATRCKLMIPGSVTLVDMDLLDEYIVWSDPLAETDLQKVQACDHLAYPADNYLVLSHRIVEEKFTSNFFYNLSDSHLEIIVCYTPGVPLANPIIKLDNVKISDLEVKDNYMIAKVKHDGNAAANKTINLKTEFENKNHTLGDIAMITGSYKFYPEMVDFSIAPSIDGDQFHFMFVGKSRCIPPDYYLRLRYKNVNDQWQEVAANHGEAEDGFIFSTFYEDEINNSWTYSFTVGQGNLKKQKLPDDTFEYSMDVEWKRQKTNKILNVEVSNPQSDTPGASKCHIIKNFKIKTDTEHTKILE